MIYREGLPRILDLNKAFDGIANWVAETTKDAPGLVVGLSGTDSALTFLICSKALEIAGKDSNCLVGIHYGKEYKFRKWLTRYGVVEVIELSENTILEPDIYRWAAIQTYALARKFWIVGTRTRTEQSLGDWSNASLVAVMQPLLPLWKSEVLALCEHLGMPKALVASGYLGDPECYCHRPGLLGRLTECEAVLAARQGDILPETIENESFYDDTVCFLELFTDGKTHKNKIPYCPPAKILDEAKSDLAKP